MTRYYRDAMTGHLVELIELLNVRTGLFRDLEANAPTLFSAQFASDWLRPVGGAACA